MTEQQPEHATEINPNDAPLTDRLDGTASQRQHYNRLSHANTLNWNGKWADENKLNEADWDATIEAVGSQLELTDYQVDRSKRLFRKLPENYQRGYRLDMLVFAVCTIAGREDGRNYHPNKLRNGGDDTLYASVGTELELEYGPFYSCWKQVQGDL